MQDKSQRATSAGAAKPRHVGLLSTGLPRIKSQSGRAQNTQASQGAIQINSLKKKSCFFLNTISTLLPPLLGKDRMTITDSPQKKEKA